MAKQELPKLNEDLLKQELLGAEVADYSDEVLDYPEKVLQIGEGNFLRCFFDWMIHQMNKQGVFKGRSVVVQPIPEGRISNLANQDNLYTAVLRGIQEGEVVDKREVLTAISRGLESYTQWEEVLELAENPDIEIVVSNTTEAGIAYRPEDNLADSPPESFPGKLTAYLYRRYQYFDGDREKGMLIIPVELIERNGDNLKRIILKLADDWALPEDFKDWIEEGNDFVNTLVDRIVTGFPEEEIEDLEQELGYRDENLTTGEIFHHFVIEGDESLKDRFPLHEIGINVKWVDDLTPYRTQKVRILNGTHTSTVPVSYLYGIDIVREAVNDDVVGQYIKEIMFDEIIPTLDFEQEELENFANDVLERFQNPFIDHRWLDISLNSTSKYKTRDLPSLLKYVEQFDELPDKLTFALAALIEFYHGTEMRGSKLVAHRDGEEYLIKDDREALEFFSELWSDYEDEEIDLRELVEKTLAHKDFWEQDLNQITGLTDRIENCLADILNRGMKQALPDLVE